MNCWTTALGGSWNEVKTTGSPRLSARHTSSAPSARSRVPASLATRTKALRGKPFGSEASSPDTPGWMRRWLSAATNGVPVSDSRSRHAVEQNCLPPCSTGDSGIAIRQKAHSPESSLMRGGMSPTHEPVSVSRLKWLGLETTVCTCVTPWNATPIGWQS
jgi:hypothetical protein